MDVKIVLVIALMLYATSEWKPVNAQRCAIGQGCSDPPCNATAGDKYGHEKCQMWRCDDAGMCIAPLADGSCEVGQHCNPAYCKEKAGSMVPEDVKMKACKSKKCKDDMCVAMGGGGGVTSSIVVTVLGLGVILATYFK